MNNERNNVNGEYKDRLFKLVFREKEDLLKLYNAVGGTDYDNPEDLEINTLEDAALDCHAEVLNINYGHNREIMGKCRKLEEYSIFIGKVRDNLNRKMPIKKAVDTAVDECIKEGILEKILRENREEVCSMLLTEYDEQAHIESEKEIAREEGIQEGIEKGREEGTERINILYRKLKEDNRWEDILRAVDDAGYQNQLLEEYGL